MVLTQLDEKIFQVDYLILSPYSDDKAELATVLTAELKIHKERISLVQGIVKPNEKKGVIALLTYPEGYAREAESICGEVSILKDAGIEKIIVLGYSNTAENVPLRDLIEKNIANVAFLKKPYHPSSLANLISRYAQ